MSNRNFKHARDKRSHRHSRIPGFFKVMFRMLPRVPIRTLTTLVFNSPSVTDLLRRLPDFFRESEAELSRHIEYTELDRQFGTYINELGGVGHRDLLTYGTYIISEASSGRRVLYVGSATATMVRHRITNHLAFKGSKRLMLRELKYELEDQLDLPHDREDERPFELALLRALFRGNRWSDMHPDSLTAVQRYAVETIESGAFEITCIAFPESDRLLARALEVFLIDCIVQETSSPPPLNAVPAVFTEDTLAPSPEDEITMRQLSRIVARVKTAALMI